MLLYKETIEKHLIALSIVLYPCLSYYGYGFCTFAFCFSLLLLLIGYKKRGYLPIIHPTAMLLYMLYFCVGRMVCNSSMMSMISPSIVFLFLYWGFLNKELDVKLFLKYYRIIAFVNVAFLFLQELMMAFGGFRIIGILSFLPLTIGADIDAAQWGEQAKLAERSSAFFSEPAHLVQFLLPLIAIELLYISDRKVYIRCSLYFIALLLLASGNALIGIFILMLFFILKIIKKVNVFISAFFVIIFSISFIYVLNYVSSTEYGEKLLKRSEEIEADHLYSGSGYLRIYRGYYILDAMTLSEKVFGLHNTTQVKEKIKRCPVAITFKENDTYMNAVQSHLIITGYIGTALFILFLCYLWIGNNLAGRCCIIIYVCLSFVASIYWGHTMILFLLSSFLMKKANTKISLKQIKIK